jgi:accessory colonization factor AcfC
MNSMRLIPLFASLALAPSMARAADLIVMISGGFKSTYEAMAPDFEKQTGSHLVLVPGPSEGSTKDAIPNRLAHGEPDNLFYAIRLSGKFDHVPTRAVSTPESGGRATEFSK